MKNNRGKTLLWTIRLCFHISRSYFIFWIMLSLVIAVFPAFVLYFQKESVRVLSVYLMTGRGQVSDIYSAIIGLGVFMAAMGVAARFNYGYIWLVLYNKYFLGTEELVMDAVQKISRKIFKKQELKEDYYFTLARNGAVTEIISTLFLLVSKFAGILSVTLVLLTSSWQLVLITWIYVLMVFLLNRHLSKKVRDRTADIKLADQRSGYFFDMTMDIGVAKEIRLFGAKKRIIGKWEAEYNQVLNFERKNDRIYALLAFCSKLIYFIFLAAILSYSISLVFAGRMELGIFTAVYAMGQTVSGSIQDMVYNYSEMMESLYVAEHQMKFHQNYGQGSREKEVGRNEESVRHDASNHLEEFIFAADHVSFSYDDKKEVLIDVSFRIKKGETIALVGCNGSGKTTLVNLLTKMYEPTSGSLSIQGVNYQDIPAEELTKKIGIFFQNSVLLHVTLGDNIGFGSIEDMERKERIEEAVRRGGAEEVLAKMPKGLDTLLMKRVDTSGVMLSGGEAQKVAIARAYMGDKDILIFDEPSAALDPIAERELFDRIRQENQEKTVILISHRVAFARMADRILVLEEGRLAEVGSHEELMEKDGIYAGFFHEQAKWYEQGVEVSIKADAADGRV